MHAETAPNFVSTYLKTVLICAISLSIGWGIRGNFGHEYGAMMPGVLTAIAACLMSGRIDWQQRVAYFAMFGGIGWAFGGSSSYMMVISYTHTGDHASQFFGFFGLFVLGLLWGGLGGAGTAFPALASREVLTGLVKVFLFVLVAWGIEFVFEWLVASFVEHTGDPTWNRHESLLYWFDTDWLEASFALSAVCVYELWQRRFAQAWMLPAWAVGCAAVGGLLHALLWVLGLLPFAARWLIHYQGDVATLQAMPEYAGKSAEQIQQTLFTNWPGFLVNYPYLSGIVAGAVIGATIYFVRHGRFRDGAALVAGMAAGWLVSFFLITVVCDIRMTPPRGDNWSGLVGVYLAVLGWLWRSNLKPVACASIITATVGGFGFSGAAFIKLMMMSLGNPNLVSPETAAAWEHWQHANWHSFLEQTYGAINGIGVAIAMLWLMRRAEPAEDSPGLRRWADIFAIAFTLLLVTWLNISKNPNDWVEHKVVPDMMKMPLFDAVNLSALTWFNIVFGFMSLVLIALMIRHRRQPIALIPASALGKGQLLYLVFLWMVVVANFERALPFSEGRIITEGTIFINAILATAMILLWPVEGREPAGLRVVNYSISTLIALVALVAGALFATYGFTAGVRQVYGEASAHKGQQQLRFGPKALWRIKPLLHGGKHA